MMSLRTYPQVRYLSIAHNITYNTAIFFFADEYNLCDTDNEIREEHESSILEDLVPDPIHSDDLSLTRHPQASSLLKWIVAFLSFLRAAYQLSNIVTSLLLQFLGILFSILAQLSVVCRDISQAFPRSVHGMQKLTGSASLNFQRYSVRRKCCQIYSITQENKKCTFQPYPRHPHQNMRQSCGTLLLKTVELVSGKTVHYPFMTYCYMSLASSLERLLQRPSFYSCCQEWRSSNSSFGVMKDIYDGKIWKEFQNVNRTPFLSEQFSFGFMINVDWFQPYKHVPYSVGAVYITILNLPRRLRNKPNNIILVGILPGPHEPKLSMNTFLQPLVEELKVLWSGKAMNIEGFSTKQVVRCALLCAACDLPAGRKLCGFLSFNSHYGCTRCWKEFSGSVGSFDFSGFDRNSWVPRTLSEHRKISEKLKECTTKSQNIKLESESGCRHTSLLELPYFNPTRMLALDPMHNLFLGTAKHVLKDIWLDKEIEILSSNNFQSFRVGLIMLQYHQI